VYNLNQTLFLTLNHFVGENHMVDSLMMVIASAMPYLFMSYLVYAWLNGRQHESLYAGYAATLGIILNQIFGALYFHNRPFMDHLGHTLLPHSVENSFPSDHTTFTVSIALTFLLFSSTRKVGIVALIFGISCGVARVYCGVHYPSDIAGSLMVAVLVTLFIWLFKVQLERLNHLIIAQWHKLVQVSFCGNR